MIKGISKYFIRTYRYGGDIQWMIKNDKVFDISMAENTDQKEATTTQKEMIEPE